MYRGALFQQRSVVFSMCRAAPQERLAFQLRQVLSEHQLQFVWTAAQSGRTYPCAAQICETFMVLGVNPNIPHPAICRYAIEHHLA